MDEIDVRLRETLERVPVSPGGLEGVRRRAGARRRRTARMHAGAAGLAVAAAACAAVIVLSGSAPPASATTVSVPGRIIDAVGTSGGLWALTCTARCDDAARSAGRLVAVDARTGRVDRTSAVRSPQAVAAGAGGVWTASFWDGTVTRTDPHSGRVLATVPLRLPRPVAGDDDRFLPADITATPTGVWVSTARGYVARIDPETNRVAAMVPTEPDAGGPLTAGGGAVWVGEGLRLGRIDPDSERMTSRTVEGPGGRRLSIGSLTMAGGALWAGGEWARPSRDATGHEDYTLTGESVLVQLDAGTGDVRSLQRLPRGTLVRGEGEGSLWLARPRAARVFRFDPVERRIAGEAAVRATGAIVPAAPGEVWVATSRSAFERVKIGTR